MWFPYRIYSLVFLGLLLCPGLKANDSDKTNDIDEDIKKIQIREGDRLTNTTGHEHNTNSTTGPFIASDDIVGQIITLLNCGSFPHPPNSTLQYSLDYETNNLRLFQTCDRLFKTIQKPESLQVQCKYKKWVFNKIQCKITTCPRLSAPAGGHFSISDNTYNTTVYFWCSRGFTINGTDKLFCEESGLWNLPPPTCHLSYCRPLSPPRHGFVSSQQETATNQTVVFTCESEYSLVGDAVLRCEDSGRWNTSAPVCRKLCIVPHFTNQLEDIRLIPGLNSLSNGSLIQQGQRVIFSCKPGYTGPSSGISTCIGGTWRPTIQCRKTCTTIKITNGKYVLSKGSSTIEYLCLPGYQLIGQQKLSCTPNMKWDSEVPTCTKMCTLSERSDVLSYRNKQTYEIIPFGTHIVDGTEVYAICRSNSSQSHAIKCVNGKINDNLCSVRLVNRLLEIYYDGKWCQICDTSNVCSLFGFTDYGEKRCDGCCSFDKQAFEKRSEIIVSTPHDGDRYTIRSYRNYGCLLCN